MVGQNRRPIACLHTVEPLEPLHPPRQEDSGQIVILENKRPLSAPRADDDLFGPNLDEPALVKRGQQISFVQAEGDGILHDASAGMIGELDGQRLDFG